MATPAREIALVRRLRTLQDILARGGYADAPEDQLAAYGARTREWMRQLRGQLVSFDEVDDVTDPLAAYLAASSRQLREMALAFAQDRVLDRPDRVVCCLLNGIYAIASSGTTSVRREVEREAYTAWLLFFREVLTTIRSMSQDGFFEVSLGILALDVSAHIRAALETALVGPLLGAMVAFEWAVDRIGQRITMAVGRTRCGPLVELWGLIVTWLYDVRGGFMRRARGFVMDTLLRLHRSVAYAGVALGQRADVGARTGTRYDWRHVDLLIEIVDTLLLAVDVFSICRVPSEELAAEGPSTTAPEGRDPRGPTGPADPRPPGADPRTPGAPPADDPYTPPGTVVVLPDLDEEPLPGTREHAESRRRRRTTSAGSRYVYLTTPNIERLLAERFSPEAAEAFAAAGGRSCREDLSPETLAVLAELGL